MGAVFSCQALIYMVASQFINAKVLVDLSPKTTMLLGGIITGFSFLLIGPVPTSEAYLLKKWMIWWTNISGLILAQIGFACQLVPAIPMIKESVDIYLTKAGIIKDDETIAGQLSSTDSDERSTSLDEDPSMNMVSAIFNVSSSLGQITGPLLSGILMQYLPKKSEVFCSPENPNLINCENGFQWTSTAIAIFSILSSILVYIFIPKRPGFGEDDSSFYISFSPEEATEGLLSNDSIKS